MIFRPGVLLALLLAWPAARASVPSPDAIAGFWQTAKGGAIIQIRDDGGAFSAHIVWLRQSRYPTDDPRGMGGQRVVDRHNPDPAKRGRPMIGLRMIKHLDYHVLDNERARWDHGRIYDPDRGKWFHCYLWLADEDHLKMHGYIGLPVLGRTTTWTRVADPRRNKRVAE